MANSVVKISNFSAVLEGTLENYREEVSMAVDAAGHRAMQELVTQTRATAPVDSGAFKKSIAWKEIQTAARWDSTFVWFVKAPYHRLTHLLVHGHANVDGGRTAGNPFLQNALNKILPKYEKEIEEALKY